MKTRRGRTLVTVGVLALGVTFCALSLPLSSSARRFPLFAGALTIVMASLQLLTDLKRPVQDGNADSNGAVTTERSAIVWTAALVAGVYLIGLSIALPLFTVLYWRLKDKSSWPGAIAAGLCVLAFVQGILVWLLRVDLYDGVISQWQR